MSPVTTTTKIEFALIADVRKNPTSKCYWPPFVTYASGFDYKILEISVFLKLPALRNFTSGRNNHEIDNWKIIPRNCAFLQIPIVEWWPADKSDYNGNENPSIWPITVVSLLFSCRKFPCWKFYCPVLWNEIRVYFYQSGGVKDFDRITQSVDLL